MYSCERGRSSRYTHHLRRRLLVTLHGLRKTGGSIALSRGVPLIVVQHQMGHSRETTTAAHYAFMLSGKELDRIGDVFASLAPGGEGRA